ncbi:MAG: hypothetical protein JSW70_01850 [Syntrophobacterales bacterium]|nr:MAG: hypothetical protein JSW70_01850 [Syntrophobacterales bacterium]
MGAALWREVTDIVLRGIVSVKDVDKAILDLSSGWRRRGDGKLIGLRKVIHE